MKLGDFELNRIYTGDARILAESIPGESADLIFTDPPYPKEYLYLWADLAAMAARVLKPGSFLVAYTGTMYLPQIMQMLGQHLNYFWTAVLHLPGSNPRVWTHRLRQQSRPILMYTKGVPGDHRWWTDYIRSPSVSKKHHRWGQSIAPFRTLIEWFTKPGDLVLDPFAGGGTVPAACKMLDRNYLVFEIDPTVAEIARERVANMQPPLAGLLQEMEQGKLKLG